MIFTIGHLALLPVFCLLKSHEDWSDMDKRMRSYASQALAISRKAAEHLQHQRKLLYNVSLVLSGVLLFLVTVYAAHKTSNYFSTNSDAIIATQQFSGGLQGNTVALPGSHANILMTPVLYIQGHLPYHYTSFTLVNIGLVLITVAAWAALLIKLFGRKYEIPILLLLASLLFSSITFNLSIGNTTFRNVAYPIALWFVFVIGSILRGEKYSRRGLVAPVAASGLFAILLAGDGFFNYSVVAPLFLVMAWYWWRSRVVTRDMLKAVGVLVAVVVGAAIVKFLLAVTGVIYFDYDFLGKPTVLASDLLGPSVQIALKQLMELQGGSIFSRTLSISNLAVFINLGVLVSGITGLIMILRRAHRDYGNKKPLANDNNFILVAMAAIYFAILLEYIFSGYVVTKMGDGPIVSFMNTRYITFMPLITIIGCVWFLKNYYSQRKYLIALSLVLTAGIISWYPNAGPAYALEDSQKPVPSKASVDQIIGILDENKVGKIVTDFWYGPPIRFWSNDRIKYAPQINCNRPLPFDSREDWFKPQPGRSALIVDRRSALNYGYWGCTDQQLMQIYGKPVKEITVPGITPGDLVNIWIYEHDASQRMLPFPTTR